MSSFATGWRASAQASGAVWGGGAGLLRQAALTPLRAVRPVLQRQEAPEKPREQPTQFPAQEQPKTGPALEDETREKLKKGGLKAAAQLGGFLWDLFSASAEGQRILAANERDWKPILKFFEDFAGTLLGKAALGAVGGGAAAGVAAGAWSDRKPTDEPDVSPSTGAPVPRAPKDEQFLALELNWDFVSPPTGMTLKTPWIDSPKIPFGSKPAAAPALVPAPQIFKQVPRVPRICTPADPQGDQGEADARSAFIYFWLKQNQDRAEKRRRELLENSTLHAPPRNAPSVLKPMFKRAPADERVHDARAVDAGRRSPGQPLEEGLRGFMESRFGQDFSRVRVHADAEAAASARAVNALAYTVGPDLVFGAGRYAPGSAEGRRLLAHELTHVVQQTGGGARAVAPADSACTVRPADDGFEREADRMADAVVRPGHPAAVPSVMPASAHAGALQRQPAAADGAAPAPQDKALRPLAQFPQKALAQWHRLKVRDRDAVLRAMTDRYGAAFAGSFIEYAFGIRRPELSGALMQSTPDALAAKGYRHAGGNVWVHPSGHEAYLMAPSAGQSAPPGPEPKPPVDDDDDDDAKRTRCADLCGSKTDDEAQCNECCDKQAGDDPVCLRSCKQPCALKL
jgi:hypothetical protein